MTSRHKAPGFKMIAGGLLLALALHYVLDEPYRLPLGRSASSHPNHRVALPINRALLLLKKLEPQKIDPPVRNDPRWHSRPLFDNASFERWVGPPNTTLENWSSSLTVAPWDVVKKEMNVVQHERSAVRLEHDGAGHCANLRQEVLQEFVPWLRTRRVRFSVWALSTTPGAPCVHIDDGADRSSACLQNPRGTWELVAVERTIDPAATRLLLIIDISRTAMGEAVGWVYVDHALLVSSQSPSEPPSPITVTAPPPSP